MRLVKQEGGLSLNHADYKEVWAISPLDGRYRGKLDALKDFVSEGALIAYRIEVEAAWLLFLGDQLPKESKDNFKFLFSSEVKDFLQSLLIEVPTTDVLKVKKIEVETRHDVKAVEYFLRDALKNLGASNIELAMVHFGCTSEDINNLAYALMLSDITKNYLLPLMEALTKSVSEAASTYSEIPMLSRTHGQPASPTTVGKELAVFAMRLERQKRRLETLRFTGKMNGAVGNYNAHVIAFPEVDWPGFVKKFLEQNLHLEQNPLTTQIENHDVLVEFVDIIRRFNVILLGFARDMWGYIALDYFTQTVKENEIGSSTMPHKVNPIDFENAEGNLGVANSLANHFAEKLPVSRWQRDLSDSTVLRNLGVMFGHSILAYKSFIYGFSNVKPNERVIKQDLENSWEVLSEAIQSVMRRYGVNDSYERLKKVTRGKSVDRSVLLQVIEDCAELPDDVRKRLEDLTPEQYIGLAPMLAREIKTLKSAL